MSIPKINVDVSTVIGYDIATALRGPDLHFTQEQNMTDGLQGREWFIGTLKYFFTGRLRCMANCQIDCGVYRETPIRYVLSDDGGSYIFLTDTELSDTLITPFINALRLLTEENLKVLNHYIVHMAYGFCSAAVYYTNIKQEIPSTEAHLLSSLCWKLVEYTDYAYKLPTEKERLINIIVGQLEDLFKFESLHPELFAEIATD